MAKLNDSLNYAKFDFVDSDDEDYVDQKILQTSMDPDATSASIRNAAAHAMMKKDGKVSTDKIGENIASAKLGMEQQLKELNDQMKSFDAQKKKLENITSPEEAAKFFEESGLSQDQIMDMMKKAGEAPEGTEAVEKTVGNVDNFVKVSIRDSFCFSHLLLTLKKKHRRWKT